MESPWIDIGAELVHAASEGLSLIEWLSSWAKVDVVSNVLVCITTMPLDCHEYPQGDDLEYCAAVALRNVDELLRQQHIGTKVEPLGTSAHPASPTGSDGAEGVAAAHAGCGAAGMRKIH